MAHDHHGPLREAQRRALWIALVANGVFMVAEAVGGIVFSSLALLADAAHMLSDVAGLGIALVAQRLLDRPSSARHTYGMQRAEVVGAQANAIVLLLVSAWVIWEAVERIGSPPSISGAGVTVVASLGLVVNVVSAVILSRAAGESLNMRGAVVHMVADAAGSVGAIGAGVAVLVWGAAWADPAVSILIAALVLWSGGRLLWETVHVLLEGAPRGMDPDDVERLLSSDAAVEGVHHLHLWNLASDTPALSAHVVLAGEMTLHEAQEHGDRLRAGLHDRFGIEHSTLELECHDCEAPDQRQPS